MAATPSGRDTKPYLASTLRAIVAYNESVYGWDKTNKNLSYGLPLLCTVLKQLYGDDKHLVLREGLRQLGSNLALSRCGARLGGGPFGLFAEIENLLNDSWSGGWRDPWIGRCVKLQSTWMLAYYPLEHLCWANAVAPKLFSINAELCSRVSCVFWTLWIVTDLFCVWRRFRELRRLEDKLRKDGSLTPSMQAAILRSRKALQFHTLRLLLFLPNAIHWTLPSGHRWGMPGTAVQVLGLAEGLVGTYTLAQGFSVANPAA